MRQNVFARMLRSSIAAMNSASTSCGTDESRKMLKVLRSAVQNSGCVRIQMYCSKPDERARVADQVPLLERDHRGVHDREEPHDREQDEERRDVEVGRGLEIPPGQPVAERDESASSALLPNGARLGRPCRHGLSVVCDWCSVSWCLVGRGAPRGGGCRAAPPWRGPPLISPSHQKASTSATHLFQLVSWSSRPRRRGSRRSEGRRGTGSTADPCRSRP